MTTESGSSEHQQATQAVPEEQNDEDEYIDIMDEPTHGLQGQNVIRSGIKQQHSIGIYLIQSKLPIWSPLLSDHLY